MLAAQSGFPSWPLASFHEKFDQRIWRKTFLCFLYSLDRQLPFQYTAYTQKRVSIDSFGGKTDAHESQRTPNGCLVFSMKNPYELGKKLINSWPKPKERKNRWTEKH
jgi:hypothetical protein